MKEYFVSNKSGVLLNALKRDVLLLVRLFQKEQSLGFAGFKDIWKRLNFSIIHFAFPEQTSRNSFMRLLYRLVLEHFNPSASVFVNLSVIYTLYLLYFSQPDNMEREMIQLLLCDWYNLCTFYKFCGENEIDDAVYIIERLISQNAFEYSAWIDKRSNILYTDGIVGINRLGTETKHLENKKKRLEDIERKLVGGSFGILENLKFSKRHIELIETYSVTKKLLKSDEDGTKYSHHVDKDAQSPELSSSLDAKASGTHKFAFVDNTDELSSVKQVYANIKELTVNSTLGTISLLEDIDENGKFNEHQSNKKPDLLFGDFTHPENISTDPHKTNQDDQDNDGYSIDQNKDLDAYGATKRDTGGVDYTLNGKSKHSEASFMLECLLVTNAAVMWSKIGISIQLVPIHLLLKYCN
ncbi:hypothetical protein BB561_005632 [Smittium simulii]|uniref:Uncharacterized protein n=1 Tax=Smittium simulii TaxID=133385 RepID=A0A2T9Y9G0_9FUNG|nr:hypothetical protein BB561_005632 [Smittium simulii]